MKLRIKTTTLQIFIFGIGSIRSSSSCRIHVLQSRNKHGVQVSNLCICFTTVSVTGVVILVSLIPYQHQHIQPRPVRFPRNNFALSSTVATCRETRMAARCRLLPYWCRSLYCASTSYLSTDIVIFRNDINTTG